MSAKVDDNFSGEIEEIAGDDKVVISYRGGKKEGKTRYISSSGKVLSEIEYKGDIIHGKVRQFYESGGILSEADYRAGKLHGNFVTYYENGVKQMEAGYVEGELQGISKTYDEFGDMLTESLYESGRRQGISKIYYPKAQGGGVYEYAEYDQGFAPITRSYCLCVISKRPQKNGFVRVTLVEPCILNVPASSRRNTSFVVLYASTLNPPLGGDAKYVTG